MRMEGGTSLPRAPGPRGRSPFRSHLVRAMRWVLPSLLQDLTQQP